MNPDLQKLQRYPFEKLVALKADQTPPASLRHIPLFIGEPKHAPPSFALDAIQNHLASMAEYPLTKGSPALRQVIVNWLLQRFSLPTASLQPETHVLPVNGTREALFAFAQCIVNRHTQASVIMLNPFYQIYEGAALLAGAEPYYLATRPENNYLPDFSDVPDAQWRRCQLIYICSPSNPTGAVIPESQLAQLIQYADQYDFVIAADECYSEIYPEEKNPPVGLLQAAAKMGRSDYRRCLVFHSLSKRSNLPGLRSGFVAGDAAIIKQFLRYRTYHGCAMPPPIQQASIQTWQDEQHVVHNRALYREKFKHVLDILQPVLHVQAPDGGFCLWANTPINDCDFTQQLFASQNVTVLPGSFLSRPVQHLNPGENHVRIALVPPLDDCIEAATRIKSYLSTIPVTHKPGDK